MTHNYLFTLYTFVLWYTIRWHETHKLKHAILLAASCGLATLVRPTELISLIIPALWGVYDKATFKEKIRLIKENTLQLACFLLTFIGICFIQLTYWKIYSGSFWFDSYYNPGEGMDLFPPHTFKFLFSFRNGWLIYTPVIILAFAGFYFLYKRNRAIFYSVFAYFIINLWIVSSWTVWWYGNCFSQRGIIACYIMLSIPLGYFLSAVNLKGTTVRILVSTLIFFLIGLNLFQSWQTANGILISPRATAKFWIAAFGKTTPLPDAEKLLYMEWPTSGQDTLKNEEDYILTHTWKLGFEPDEECPKEKLDTSIVHSGKSAFLFDSITEFGPALRKKYSEITDKYHAWIRVSVWIYPLSDLKQSPASIVTTFMHRNQAYKYVGHGTENVYLELNKWNRITFDYLTPMAIRNEKDLFEIYIWNGGKGKFLADDLEVRVLEPNVYPYYF